MCFLELILYWYVNYLKLIYKFCIIKRELVLKSVCFCDFFWVEGLVWGVRIGLLFMMVYWWGKFCINWVKLFVSKILILGYVSCIIGIFFYYFYGLYCLLRNICFCVKI